MGRITSFFGIPEENDKIVRLAKTISVLGPLATFTVVMSTTFYLIFVAEALGGGPGKYVDGLPYVGILIAVQMAIQIILDYPTGALGDWIGQRYVLASASICYAISFFMVSYVDVATPFWYLILLYVIQGVANSQQSGAWPAWFDNNYRVAMPGDEDRRQYGVFMGKFGMVMGIISTSALIPGSIIAAAFGRPFVFQLEAVLMIVLAVAIMRLVQDFPEVEESRQDRPSYSEYTTLLGDGIRFLFSNQFVKYLVIGGMLAASSIMVWGNLILFPLYFSYLITDVAVAGFRTVLFFPGIFSQERSGVWSQRFEPKKWIPRFRLLQTCGLFFFLAISAIMAIFPPALPGDPTIDILLPMTDIPLLTLPYISIIPVLLMLVAFVSTSFFGAFAEILTMRELLDVIPNRIRNSMYSLSPTIATMLALPQIAIFGGLLPVIGFPATLALCGTISLIGVIMIRHGLKQSKPARQDEELLRKAATKESDGSFEEGWPDDALEAETSDQLIEDRTSDDVFDDSD
ncbi:MAG: MFS transporter [Candidatus Thorarchaeota archaeon]